MKDFSGSGNVVTGFQELSAETIPGWEMLLPFVAVFVATCRPGAPSAHQGTTTRFAGGDGAVGVGKGGAHSCEPIDIRRFSLRVSPEMAYPVIEVVYRDKENIRFFRRLAELGDAERQKDKKEDSLHGLEKTF